VAGLQKSGLESAVFLQKYGAIVTVTDTRGENELASAVSRLRENTSNPVKFELGFHDKNTFASQDVLILSPGVPADSEYVAAAVNACVEVISEIEFASWFASAPYLAITGTNGKTTTTTLCYEILKNSGIFKKVFLGGNIGIPFIGFADETSPGDAIVLEISSFQMEWVNFFAPRAAMLLNITEDHLNRHHTLQNYIDMKMRVFKNQTPSDFAVINADDDRVLAESSKIGSKIIKFTIKNDAGCDVFVKNGVMCAKSPDTGSVIEIISASELGIIGPHNLSNAAAASAMAFYAFGVPVDKIAATLREFKGVHHRLEFIGMVKDISFYNDSKATNEDSTVTALRSFKTPVSLIAGGSDKGSDFKAFAAAVKAAPVKKVYIIGQVSQKMRAALEGLAFNGAVICETLEQCVRKAYEGSVPGDTVLLSPACASLDMFKNYEHRGEVFVNEVKRIGGSA